MRLSRRDLLQQGGTAGMLLLASAACSRRQSRWAIIPPTVALTNASACVLTPKQTEGPFYFDPRLERRDIAEGKPGIPLELVLKLVNAADCQPISQVRVDIWHTDAMGWYSGYPNQRSQSTTIDTTGQQFLRGIQYSDAQGQVHFDTIYPGWYPGRVTHVHFKAVLPDRHGITSQLYFPPEVNQQVYALPPYDQRGPGDTSEADDLVLYFNGGGERLHMTVEVLAGDHLRASHTIGLAV